jgi:hypothetical protein
LEIEKILSNFESEFCNIRNNKLAQNKRLTINEFFHLITFIAAMHSRTQANRNHWKNQFNEVLEVQNKIAKAIKEAPPEKREEMISILSKGYDETKESFSLEEIKELHEQPLQKLLGLFIKSEAEVYAKMNFAVINTRVPYYFITSDRPCVWFDPEWYKLPPYFRSPNLNSKTIEVTFPVSPNQLVILSWYDQLSGYIDIKEEELIEGYNGRTRFFSDNYFISSKNKAKKQWFDTGEPLELI